MKTAKVPDLTARYVSWLRNWAAFSLRNADLLQDSRTLLTRHYTEATIFSDEARKHFLMPNKSLDTSVSP